jgi:hypothetical protein
MRFADATAYEILWAQTVVVEIGALEDGEHQEGDEAGGERCLSYTRPSSARW